VEPNDNELLVLEVIHRYVELLDKYFGSVSMWFIFSSSCFCSKYSFHSVEYMILSAVQRLQSVFRF